MSVKFNSFQLRAVNHVYGPMLVLAGPGSGKTAVITGRLENLILKAKIPPEQILVVTFSKKAALEMEDRFLKKELKINGSPVFGTFHSIFFSILRLSSSSFFLKPISEKQKQRFIRSELESTGLEFDNPAELTQKVINEISSVKGNRLDINGFSPQSLPGQTFKAIYEKYESFLAANSLLDFDDMLLKCGRLLSEDPEILRKWQEKYPFILIDEFQDINILQYEIIGLLSGKKKNVFAVGDDDQSIYGFRGARPELLKRFLKDYKGARIVFLEINYRSAPEITEASLKVISKNEDRFQKNIVSFNNKRGKGSVRILSFPDKKAEAAQIANQILSFNKKGIPFKETALLYRNNSDMEYISEKLSALGLPIKGKNTQPSFYGNFIAKDILAYMRAALYYPSPSLSDMLLIMNRPERYLSRQAFSLMEKPFLSLERFYAKNPRLLPEVKRLEEDLKTLGLLSPYAAVKYIRMAIGYENYLKEYARENRTDFEKYEKILDDLEKEASRFPSITVFLEHMKKEEESSSSRTDNVKKTPEDALNLMTIHASKGLEFEAVFIPDCIDSIIPGKNSSSLYETEEERRVLYVAMTRAKTFLQISCIEKIRNKKALPSRFLKPLM